MDDFRSDLWSANFPSVSTSIVFLSNELAKPSEYSIRCKENGTMLQHLSAELLAFGSHPHPLPSGEQKPLVLPFLLFKKHPNLFPKIVNGFVEFFIYTVCKTSDYGQLKFLFIHNK